MAHDHEMYMTLADTALELRDLAALQKYVPKLEQLAGRDNHPLYLAIAHRARGGLQRLAGESAKAEASLKRALEIFNRLGTRWQAGRTLLELAELAALARSKKSKAREHLTQALAAFEELRALPDAEKTRLSLDSLA